MRKVSLKQVVCIACIALYVCMGTLAVGAAETKTLSFMIFGKNPQTEEWLTSVAVPEFEKENPGVKVEVAFSTSTTTHLESILVSTAAGIAPDVFKIGAGWLGDVVEQELVLPLDSYAAHWSGSSDLIPTAYQGGFWQGKLYAIPWMLESRTLLYRKSTFSEAGLNPDQPPVAWDDLSQAARKLTRVEDGVITRLGFRHPNVWHNFITFVWQAGGEILNEDSTKAIFDSEEGIEALRFRTELWQQITQGLDAPRNLSYNSSLVNGKLGMTFNSTLGFASFRANGQLPEDDLVIADPPKKRRQQTMLYIDRLSVSKVSKNPDIAWKFIEFLLEPENAMAYNHFANTIPPRKSLLGHSLLTSDPWQLRHAEVASQYGRDWPFKSDFGALTPALNAAMNGEKSPAAALQEAAYVWNAELSSK